MRARADPLSTKQRSSLMSRVRSRGNRSTEVAVEEVLRTHRIRGWVKHPHDVLGRPDFYFPKDMLAIFVDGCFWHRCRRCARSVPSNRHLFWLNKIAQNVRRDERIRRTLRRRGYSVMRIWEHSIPHQRTWLARMRRMLDRRSK